MASRTEADAMILKFFSKMEFNPQAGAMLMQEFRDFRAQLDDEKIESMITAVFPRRIQRRYNAVM